MYWLINCQGNLITLFVMSANRLLVLAKNVSLKYKGVLALKWKLVKTMREVSLSC